MKGLIFAFIMLLMNAEPIVAQLQKDMSLADQLRTLYNSDQKYRNILNSWEEYSEKDKDSVARSLKLPIEKVINVLWERQEELDKQNITTVKKIIAKHGYPGKSLVGDTLSEYAWYVLQHSDEIDTYFPIIEAAGRKGELQYHLVAKMKDRLLANENKLQLYGTQAVTINVYDPATRKYIKELVIWPVEDAANIDKRRKGAGFKGNIKDAAHDLHARFDPDLTIEKLECLRKIVLQDEDGYTAEIKEKARMAMAINLPDKDCDGSTFRYMQLADSFAIAGNFLMAEQCFSHLNVHHLLFLNYSPATISNLYKRFKLSDSLKQKYTQQFTTAYTCAKTPSYDSFQKFYNQIRSLKSRYDTARSDVKKIITCQLFIADTVHAAFLSRYIYKHGWPSFEDGSLFASYLACRHADQWYNYLPVMYDAFQKKQVSYSYLKSVSMNRKYAYDYHLYKNAILSNAFEWDFSVCLSGEFLPAKEIADILQQAKMLCPDYQVFFVFLKPRAQMSEEWLDVGDRNFKGQFDRFLSAMYDNCEKVHPESLKYIRSLYPSPENNEQALKLYIVPSKKK